MYGGHYPGAFRPQPATAAAWQQHGYHATPTQPAAAARGPPSCPSQSSNGFVYSGPPPAAPNVASVFPAPQYAQPQPDALTIATDPVAFASMYQAELATLTFNSKPLITNLTILAHEHVHRMANVVAQCLDEHIMQSHPMHRLPAMYLLDSICKNIGPPYTDLWAERIQHIFLESYRIVDQATKVKLEQLLATWKDSGAGGRPLFGEQAQWNMERALYGSHGPPVAVAAPPPAPFAGTLSPLQGGRSPMLMVGANVPTEPQAQERMRIAEQIDRLLALMSMEPHKSNTANRTAALKQLKALVQAASLSSSELALVRSQLTSINEEFTKTRREASSGVRSPSVAAAQPAGIHSPLPSRPQAAATPPILPANLADTLANLSKLGALKPTPPSGHLTPRGVPSAPSSFTSAPPNDLIKNLMQAGLLSAAGAAPSQPMPPDQDADYASAILSLDIRLTSSDLAKEPSVGAVELLLHKHLPLQCRQCANRYPAGDVGKRTMDEHLDWHFRQNRRAKDSAARGQSRSWFAKLDHWIRGGFDDTLPESRTDGADGKHGGVATMTAAQRDALDKASKSWVVAPTGEGGAAAAKTCPICKEPFETEWSEDEEDWIWRNAVCVNDTYYHGTCHYSAKALSETVSKGGGSDGDNTGLKTGSRSSTPQTEGATSHPLPLKSDPVARIKEEEGVGVDGGATALTTTTPSASRKRKESPTVADSHDGAAAQADGTAATDHPESATAEEAGPAKRQAL